MKKIIAFGSTIATALVLLAPAAQASHYGRNDSAPFRYWDRPARYHATVYPVYAIREPVDFNTVIYAPRGYANTRYKFSHVNRYAPYSYKNRVARHLRDYRRCPRIGGWPSRCLVQIQK